VRKGLGVAALCAATLDPAAAGSRVDPRLHARALAPGEVVRLEVTTDGGAQRLTGTFGGAGVTFVEASRSAAAVTWIAWAAIPLDASAGGTSYEVTATDAGGGETTARADATIVAKTFPEQRLTVESKFVNPPKAALARIEKERKRLDAIYASRSGLLPPAAPFVRPVPGEPTSEFGTRRIFNGEPRSPHPGIDLRAATGTPVAAAGPGRVALAADLYYSGGTVIIDHGGGLFTIYAHLSKIESKEGAALRAGDRVGLSGATGRVTGPHLHWGARVGAAIFDPRALMDPRVFGAATPSSTAPGASPVR
jgi:murein DD-endopeptidase MepM/ murein hydrolase activator NlpD